ncbi:hypothetical protein SpCBS45565_g06382 [Spizellomyces sp. 'palustris']|nr:hypothetical protein SpCBS45565_g06382 [Spizellomyces sp. 'palustris']
MSQSHPCYKPDVLQDILKAKERGTEAYKKGQYGTATAEYSKAIANFSTAPIPVDPQSTTDPKVEPTALLGTLKSNRSASYFNEKKYEDALKDADDAVRLRPDWAKGYFRRAEVYRVLGRYSDALEAYEAAHQRDVRDRLILERLTKTKIILKDASMGLALHQLAPGRDLCQKSFMTPIQNMIFEYAVQMRNFIYFVENLASKECLVVDACWDIDGILKFAQKRGLKIVGAVVTHYHVDHVGGLPPPPFDRYRVRVDGLAKLLKKLPKIKAYVNPADIPGILKANPEIPHDRFSHTEDGGTLCLPMSLNIGLGGTVSGQSDHVSDGRSTIIQFIHTPGHTPGSQCILINGSRLLSGDTLFMGACGRVDFPDSDRDEMYHSLQHKLAALPDDVIVYPGHNYGGEMTTIENERQHGLLKPKPRDDFMREFANT